MKNILNLTQHTPTPDQVAAGVCESSSKQEVQTLLTFDELPSAEEVWARARALAQVARREGASFAMIGGAPFLMGPLEAVLKEEGIAPLYSFTRREAGEEPDGMGGVRKTQVFRHVGFIEACVTC